VLEVLGAPVPRVEDEALLTGHARFVADLELDGACHAKLVGSPVAHARISTIDASEAAATPEVVAVITAADLDVPPLPSWLPLSDQRMRRSLLAADVVRFVGEPVAAVVAATPSSALDAAELVAVQYDPLPVVVDPRLAERDATLLFPEAGTNTVFELPEQFTADLLADCDVTIAIELVHQRMAACPIEPRVAAAVWEDGRLTYWASTAEPHGLRSRLAQALNLTEDRVRVIVPNVGGAFGGKGGDYVEELLIGWLARTLERPIKWVETRSETMLRMYHGRALVQKIELGGTREGKILAYRNEVLQDAGAYPTWTPMLIRRARVLASGAYAVPRIECGGRGVVTNTTPVGTVRGAGRPEANIAIERAIDVFAAEIGQDPLDVRRRNVIPVSAFPYTTATGSVYDSGDYAGMLERVVSAGKYEELRREQARRRQRGDPWLLGIGLAMYVEISDADAAGEYAAIEVSPEGRAIARVGAAPHGQGHQTALAQIVSACLGLRLEDVSVRMGDTDDVPSGVGSFGSRTAQAAGTAVYRAARKLVDQARRQASVLLGVTPEQVEFDPAAGRFLKLCDATTIGWAEVARAAAARGEHLAIECPPSADQTAAWPSGAVLASVEVDSETGFVEVRSLVTCDDVGRVLNSSIVAGQVHGGLAFGIAHALLEEFVYDEEGQPLTTTFADYPVISIDRTLLYEVDHLTTLAPGNMLGAKGAGEAGSVGAPAAILNAVVDAVSHLGVRHLSPPATPEKVVRAIADAGEGDR
jgi:carbon-monoxide dehydrogenase large subunit